MNMKGWIKFIFRVHLARIYCLAIVMHTATNVAAMTDSDSLRQSFKSEIWQAARIGDVNHIDKIIKDDDETLLEKNHGRTPGEEARIHGFLTLGDVLDKLTSKKKSIIDKKINRAPNKRKSLSIKRARPFIKKSEGIKDKETLIKDCKHVVKIRSKLFLEASRGNMGFLKKFLNREKTTARSNLDYLIFFDEQGKTASMIAESNGFLDLGRALIDVEHWMNADLISLEKKTMEILIEKIKYFTHIKENIEQVAHLLTYEVTNKIFFKHGDLYEDLIANFESYFLAKALSRKFWSSEEAWNWLNEKMLTEKMENHRRVDLIHDKDLTDELSVALRDFDLMRINNLIINGADLERDDIEQRLNEVKRTVLLSYALQDYYSWIMYFRPDFYEELEKQQARTYHSHFGKCIGDG